VTAKLQHFRSTYSRQLFIQKALALLASQRYLEKGTALMALTGRRPAEIFFSAKFSVLFGMAILARTTANTLFDSASRPAKTWWPGGRYFPSRNSKVKLQLRQETSL
jgi:hypothetical protein